MPKSRSAATAFVIDQHPEGLHKAVELSKAEATEKLGGEDGLVCQSANTREDGRINVVWKRNWEEAEVDPPQVSEDDAVTHDIGLAREQ